MAFLITFLGTLSSINIGVICRFVFFSVRYLSFFVRLRNLACDIFGIVLFLIHLLFSQSVSCLQLWNPACKILGLVLFLFDLLCAISLCGLPLWNPACGIFLGLVLFLWHLLCAISLSGIRLLKFPCEMDDDVVLFILDLHGVTIGRFSGVHGLFQVYWQMNAIPANLLHNTWGGHAYCITLCCLDIK